MSLDSEVSSCLRVEDRGIACLSARRRCLPPNRDIDGRLEQISLSVDEILLPLLLCWYSSKKGVAGASLDVAKGVFNDVE